MNVSWSYLFGMFLTITVRLFSKPSVIRLMLMSKLEKFVSGFWSGFLCMGKFWCEIFVLLKSWYWVLLRLLLLSKNRGFFDIGGTLVVFSRKFVERLKFSLSICDQTLSQKPKFWSGRFLVIGFSKLSVFYCRGNLPG